MDVNKNIKDTTCYVCAELLLSEIIQDQELHDRHNYNYMFSITTLVTHFENT